jgi:hypothetical protein
MNEITTVRCALFIAQESAMTPRFYAKVLEMRWDVTCLICATHEARKSKVMMSEEFVRVFVLPCVSLMIFDVQAMKIVMDA